MSTQRGSGLLAKLGMRFQRRSDADFQAEIESHIRLETDRLIAEGMEPAEAFAAARRAFGNVTIARERFYEARRWAWLNQLAQDLRFGLRSLRDAPGFTAAAMLTIALGVGANTAVFSVMDAVLMKSLPVENPKQLVFLEAAGSAGTSGPPPYPYFARLREETSSFSALAAFSSDELRIAVDGSPEQVMGQVATGNYFELLGVKPLLGRLMNSADEELNPPVAVISERYWRRRFGSDPAAIGTSLSFRDKNFVIVGVTPAGFFGLAPGSPIDVTLPISIVGELLTNSSTHWMQAIVGRLRPEASMSAAQSEADVVFRSFMAASDYPADIVAKRFHHMEASTAAKGLDVLRRRFSEPLYVLMGIVGMLLLVAVANIANLILARGVARRREFAIRLAVGAGRVRLIRQLLTETTLLFSLGVLPGVACAKWGIGLLEGVLQEGRRPITIGADLDVRVLLFALFVALAAALASGLFPAWHAFRTDPQGAIKEGPSRTTESRGAGRLTQSLVVAQVSLSLVLLVGALLFAQTLSKLRDVDTGFQSNSVLTMSIQAPDGLADTTALWSKALTEIRAAAGVRSAAVANYTPLSGRDRGAMVRASGSEPLTAAESTIHMNHVSAGYFETLRINLVDGRLITDQDTAGGVRVALINESAARQFFGNRQPIGQSLEFPSKGPAGVYRIVGIVRDTKHRNLREASPPFAFLAVREPRDLDQRVTLLLSATSSGQEMTLLPTLREALTSVDPGILISDVATIQTQLDVTLLTERLMAGLSTAFGLLALVLAAVGLYGVLSYQVGRQRQSIGIRMALGATPSAVSLGVLRRSLKVVAIGLVVGLPFAIAAARMAEGMLWGVTASDPLIYLGCAAMLGIVAIVSAYLPARRASTIEPLEALRLG